MYEIRFLIPIIKNVHTAIFLRSLHKKLNIFRNFKRFCAIRQIINGGGNRLFNTFLRYKNHKDKWKFIEDFFYIKNSSCSKYIKFLSSPPFREKINLVVGMEKWIRKISNPTQKWKILKSLTIQYWKNSIKELCNRLNFNTLAQLQSKDELLKRNKGINEGNSSLLENSIHYILFFLMLSNWSYSKSL